MGKTRERIEQALAEHPQLADRIYRALLIHMHSEGITSVDEIYAAGRERVEARPPAKAESDNVSKSRRLADAERLAVNQITLEHAAKALTPEQVEDLVAVTRRREEADSLEEISGLPNVSFRDLSHRVRKYSELPVGQTKLRREETEGIRVSLIRHFVSEHLELLAVAKSYLKIRDINYLMERMVGDKDRMGKIGGKAAGMLLAHRIIESAKKSNPDAPKLPIAIPDSFFLRSDVIERFLEINSLVELQNHKYKTLDEIRNEYPLNLEMFKNGDFPAPEREQLRRLLEKTGKHPLIVRSSSLLEDRFGTSFAGKYRSVFLPNQGTPDENLDDLLGAITEVYASILHPDPISYRQRHNLLDFYETMGVLIQKVVGRRFGKYFAPIWAGVSFSRNEYRWSPRIKREDGLARIVVGLGTRAVDRVSSDYPRMIPLGLPTLRPVASREGRIRYSQRLVDVINVHENRFETIPLSDLLSEGRPAELDPVLSILQDGELQDVSSFRGKASGKFFTTFDRFARESPYPAMLRWVLQVLEAAYKCPVDVEFAYDGQQFYLLQCRPQVWRPEDARVTIPNVEQRKRIFSASRNITTGSVHDIEFVVLIDPRDYDTIDSADRRQRVARAVQQINQKLADRRFILMGPGRWGSADIQLGIPVSYSDIDNTAMLIEIARAQGDHVPEVSFGTHFFQDLVEANIRYLALYPDDADAEFNEPFLHGSTNRLADVAPECAELVDIVRVIDVTATGHKLNIDMDGDSQLALGYLQG